MIYLTPYLFQSENISELVAALVEFQKGFEKVQLKKDAKSNLNKYVSLDNLLNAIRPILSQCGLTICQDLAGEHLTTVIYHTSGQFRGSMMPFSPMTGNRGTNELQQLGGGITYAKRYALSAALGISVDTDDDGQSSTMQKKQLQKKPVETTEQIEQIAIWAAKQADGFNKALQYYEMNDEQQLKFEELFKNAKNVK